MTNEVTLQEPAVLDLKHDHWLISGIGVVHGLASNDELLLLLTITLALTSLPEILFSVFIFTIGVVTGMIFYGLLLKLPLSKYNQEKLIKGINLSISGLTILYAIYLLLGGETINLFPIGEDSLSGSIIVIALILGMKHSLDADHVVAISGILLRAPSALRTASLATAWALGHMVTASLITTLLFIFKEALLTPILDNFEIIVAYMLLLIGVLTILWELDIIRIGKSHHHHPGVDDHHDHGHEH